MKTRPSLKSETLRKSLMLKKPNSKLLLLTRKILLNSFNNKTNNFKKQVPTRKRLCPNFKLTSKNNQLTFKKKVLLSSKKSNLEIEFQKEKVTRIFEKSLNLKDIWSIKKSLSKLFKKPNKEMRLKSITIKSSSSNKMKSTSKSKKKSTPLKTKFKP